VLLTVTVLDGDCTVLLMVTGLGYSLLRVCVLTTPTPVAAHSRQSKAGYSKRPQLSSYTALTLCVYVLQRARLGQ
jgi:hypothetical protein